MEASSTNIPLIRTKLHRPSMAVAQVRRQHLLDRLDAGLDRHLTVVSAPAGYGKSNLVSHWLEDCDLPTAWFSMDETDNDIHLFLTYFLAAVQTIHPHVGEDIQIMLKAIQLPPLPALTARMINELAEIDETFVLVIDDFHLVRNKSIHELFDELLKHPPHAMHLTLVSRIDPPLSLAKLRAKGQMTEVRASDLRFTQAEAAEFLSQMVGDTLKDSTITTFTTKTEGWITGLHLAALSLRGSEGLDSVVADLPANNRFVVEYLVEEILSQQDPEMQACLLKTSILNRFCAPLCNAVCASDGDSGDCEKSDHEFLQQVEQANLFVIPLDNERKWFRYHHLFQSLLKRSLEKRLEPKRVKQLHTVASRWLSENGFTEEALQHAIESGDMEAAADLVYRRRHEIMNSEQWSRLDAWLAMLPAEVIEKKPGFALLKAWVSEVRMRPEEIGIILKQVEPHFISEPEDDVEDWKALRAEFYSLSAFDAYLRSDTESSINLANEALNELVQEAEHARALALCMASWGHQISGNLSSAHDVIHKAQQAYSLKGTTYHTKMHLILAMVHWMAADLLALRQVGIQILEICEEADLPESRSVAQHFLGALLYLRNELEEADVYLGEVHKHYFKSTILNAAHNSFVLALSLQGQGRSDEALEMVESSIKKALESGSNDFLHLAEALQAEVFLRQGQIAKAQPWAENFEVRPFHPGYRFYIPQFTYVKALLARNIPTSHQEAEDLLCELHDYYASAHNTKCLIDVLVLQAVLYDGLGKESRAYEKLSEALSLSEPGELIRPFLDLGHQMHDLLKRFAEEGGVQKFALQVLGAFANEKSSNDRDADELENGQPPSASDQPLPEPLTHREIEILRVLSKGLSNQAIAERLFISPETVKRHLYNIFQKLDAKNRQQAIVKARSLGLV